MTGPTDAQWAALVASARRACGNTWSPYSRFPVGAAVLAGDGTVAAGCNVENASSGLTVCAERVAVFRAVADGARAIDALVVYTPTAEPVTPCGACRQVLAEFGPDAAVRCICDGERVLDYRLSDLLPHAFSL
jgi:cytidine deaminase